MGNFSVPGSLGFVRNLTGSSCCETGVWQTSKNDNMINSGNPSLSTNSINTVISKGSHIPGSPKSVRNPNCHTLSSFPPTVKSTLYSVLPSLQGPIVSLPGKQQTLQTGREWSWDRPGMCSPATERIRKHLPDKIVIEIHLFAFDVN